MRTLAPDCIKLGFGMMRLPKREDGTIDVGTTAQMVDEFLAAGGRYVDTAFVYEGSEDAVRQALVERHPRDSYYLATKLNAGEWAAKDEAAAKAEFEQSLERTGAGYFDFYLLHALSSDNVGLYDSYGIWEYVRDLKARGDNVGLYDSYGIWEYVRDLKARGLVRHMGFSFHDGPELLDRLLTEHPEAEFVQLQLNYADWEDPVVQSRANYEVAVAHDVPVVVMEPVKGGTLAALPPAVAEIFRSADATASPAQWAIRFVASLPNVMMVLSGMSTPEQMADNLSFMRDFRPLSKEESATVDEVRRAFDAIDRIACTSCHYCTGGCPVHMHIPDIFRTMNEYKLFGNLERSRKDYVRRAGDTLASECIQCGQCEQACPQHLPIVSLLEEAAATLE